MLAAVAALAALALGVSLLNLVLTLGVIRRLREHTALLAKLAPLTRPLPPMLAEGQTAGPFETVTTTGEAVASGALTGETLVAVFSPQCSACRERMPEFLDHAQRYPGGRDQVIAVIVGADEDAGTYREQLEPVARVVVEPPAGGQISTALAVGAFPAFGVLDASGKLLHSGVELPRPATTAA